MLKLMPALLLSLAASPASAEEAPEVTEAPAAPASPAAATEPSFRYVIGAGLRWAPEAAGARRHDSSLKPLWAVRWGRWRLSTSGGSSLLGFGNEVLGAGASTDLFRGEQLRLGMSLRIDSGRKSADASSTEGLPNVRRTLRGRVFGSYALSSNWNVSGSLSQDLLGHKGGLTAGLDLGWRLRHSAHSEWTAGAGLSAADGRNMRSYFGITPEGSAASGLAVYRPGAGLRDAHAGVGWTYGLSQRWIVFSSAGVSYLLGPAADSPLTQRRFGTQLGVGLAYRN